MVGRLSVRVLLVDDDPLVRRFVSRRLVAAGYVVRVAVDGLEALAKLRAGLPDLIISDLTMPRMAGLEFLRVVRLRFPQIPVIIMSGLTVDQVSREAVADAYYHKDGFGFEKLLETISDLAGRLPLRRALPPMEYKPVPAKWDGDGHYRLECPDCMRVTTIPHSPRLSRGEHIATCIHCCGVIKVRIDEEDSSEGAPA